MTTNEALQILQEATKPAIPVDVVTEALCTLLASGWYIYQRSDKYRDELVFISDLTNVIQVRSNPAYVEYVATHKRPSPSMVWLTLEQALKSWPQ